jgi:S-adenosylmethionine:tRNA ribosyltransferase-isomerase
VSAAPATRFVLPPALCASRPAEARGLARDEVRLLVAERDRITHVSFRDLGRFLTAGDLLVVNVSGTRAAAVDGVRRTGGPGDGAPVVVHFSVPLDDGTWVVELRSAPAGADPVLDAAPGEQIELPAGAGLVLVDPYPGPSSRLCHRLSPGIGGGHRPGGGYGCREGTAGGHPAARRLWRAAVATGGSRSVEALLGHEGRPVRYGYVSGQWPLAAYQTVFATEPGSAEMPSAGRPFTAELVTRLVAGGIVIAPIVLHTGLSSQERGEPPQPERFRVPATTARLVNWTRRAGGRVVAVGTTVTRALESAVQPDGSVAGAQGWTELVLGPDRPARVVSGLVTGLHAPEASHLQLLEAVAGPELVQRTYDAALEHRYLWHEFGDACLLLPDGPRPQCHVAKEDGTSGRTMSRSSCLPVQMWCVPSGSTARRSSSCRGWPASSHR